MKFVSFTINGSASFGAVTDAGVVDLGARHDELSDLRDALRAIVNAGYNMTKFANLREVLTTGDEAIGALESALQDNDVEVRQAVVAGDATGDLEGNRVTVATLL